jgi:hypothetical protein
MSNPWITRYMKDLDRLKTIQAVIHEERAGSAGAKILAVFTVEKGKPLTTVVQ